MLVRQTNTANFIDVLDRILDKGIVIDGWVALSVAGINLVTVDARIVVASVETYLRNADSVTRILEAPYSRPS
jgi:gas vesicle structural protein